MYEEVMIQRIKSTYAFVKQQPRRWGGLALLTLTVFGSTTILASRIEPAEAEALWTAVAAAIALLVLCGLAVKRKDVATPIMFAAVAAVVGFGTGFFITDGASTITSESASGDEAAGNADGGSTTSTTATTTANDPSTTTTAKSTSSTGSTATPTTGQQPAGSTVPPPDPAAESPAPESAPGSPAPDNSQLPDTCREFFSGDPGEMIAEPNPAEVQDYGGPAYIQFHVCAKGLTAGGQYAVRVECNMDGNSDFAIENNALADGDGRVVVFADLGKAPFGSNGCGDLHQLNSITIVLTGAGAGGDYNAPLDIDTGGTGA